MALSVNFAIAAPLQEALAVFVKSEAQRAIVVGLEDETLVLRAGPFALTSEFDVDLKAVRDASGCAAATDAAGAGHPALILLNPAGAGATNNGVPVDNSTVPRVLVVCMPEVARPRERMLYASAAGHVRNVAKIEASDVQLTAIAQLVPSLFSGDAAANRHAMKTEKELLREEMSKLAVVTPNAGLPGLALGADAGLKAAYGSFKEGQSRALVVVVTPGAAGLALEGVLPAGADNAAVVAAIPADHPRFVLLRWPEGADGATAAGKAVLVYVCPSACKPKERMPYASAKAGFVAELGSAGIAVAKSVEIDDAKEMPTAIAESLVVLTEEDVAAKPVAPRPPVGAKGPRMLI